MSSPSRWADLFRGFSAQTVTTERGAIFVRKAGKGPPLLLLHGYPETHACWHKIASRLAEYCTVFVCDLPGYAQSGIAKTNCENNPYSKREMASALLSAMK